MGVATAGDVTRSTQWVRRPGLQVFSLPQTDLVVTHVDFVDLATTTQLWRSLQWVGLTLVVAVIPGMAFVIAHAKSTAVPSDVAK